MSGPAYYAMALFLAVVLAAQLLTGVGLGAWWYPRITREDDPPAYWFVITAQAAILVAFVATGRSWHLR